MVTDSLKLKAIEALDYSQVVQGRASYNQQIQPDKARLHPGKARYSQVQPGTATRYSQVQLGTAKPALETVGNQGQS